MFSKKDVNVVSSAETCGPFYPVFYDLCDFEKMYLNLENNENVSSKTIKYKLLRKYLVLVFRYQNLLCIVTYSGFYVMSLCKFCTAAQNNVPGDFQLQKHPCENTNYRKLQHYSVNIFWDDAWGRRTDRQSRTVHSILVQDILLCLKYNIIMKYNMYFVCHSYFCILLFQMLATSFGLSQFYCT
jgi:hypothetical protein